MKTSLPAPIFTNSLSHRVGKRWQDLNSRNKGWVWCRNYQFLNATYSTVSKILGEYPKHAEWGGVCLPCAQHAAVQSKSEEDADKRDFKILAILCLIQSCREAPLFPLNPAFSHPLKVLQLLPSFSLSSARWCLSGFSIFIYRASSQVQK